jgi:disulfide bond formation protein DsbB
VEDSLLSSAAVKSIERPEPSDRALLAALAILMISLATIAGAWFFQLALDIKPCPLCLEQRYAYYAEIPLALGVLACSQLRASRAVLMAGFLVLLGVTLFNAGFGVYHSGVEWGWWPGPTECTGPITDLGGGSLFDTLGAEKVVRCDEVQWRFLGLSLAGYNALISAFMAVIAASALAGLASRRS